MLLTNYLTRMNAKESNNLWQLHNFSVGNRIKKTKEKEPKSISN